MRKLSLRVLQRQLEAQAQERLQPLQPVVQRAAAQREQVQRAREQLELAPRLALLERLRERYQPSVQPSQALVWLVLSARL